MKKILRFIFLFIFLFSSNVGNILAAGNEFFPATSSQVISGTSQTGPAVIVNYSDKNYFVPNKTLGEWSSFFETYTPPPAGTPLKKGEIIVRENLCIL